MTEKSSSPSATSHASLIDSLLNGNGGIGKCTCNTCSARKEAAETIQRLERELAIQNEANEILTRQLAETTRSETRQSAIREALKDMADDVADHIKAGTLKCDVCTGHVNAARDLLASAPSAIGSRWIACADRIPENYATVLATDGEIASTGFWTGSVWVVDVAAEMDPLMTPTHWMPLPEAP